MPLYSFLCDKCKAEEERITKMDVVAITCECGGMKQRQISTPRIALDGTDPSLPGAHMAWADKRRKRFADKQRSES